MDPKALPANIINQLLLATLAGANPNPALPDPSKGADVKAKADAAKAGGAGGAGKVKAAEGDPPGPLAMSSSLEGEG